MDTSRFEFSLTRVLCSVACCAAAWYYGAASAGAQPANLTFSNQDIQSTGWAGWLTSSLGLFPDFVGYDIAPGGSSPATACPAGDCTGNTNLGASTVANASVTQSIVVGSQTISPLGRYVYATPNTQVRYTDNGRDQPATWSCPAH